MAVYLAGNGLEQKLFARIHVHLAVKHQVNPRNDAGYIKLFILRNKQAGGYIPLSEESAIFNRKKRKNTPVRAHTRMYYIYETCIIREKL